MVLASLGVRVTVGLTSGLGLGTSRPMRGTSTPPALELSE